MINDNNQIKAAKPEHIEPTYWVRTCQECGNRQKAKEPNNAKPLTDAYRDAICKRCKSSGLDYGSYQKLQS